MYRSHFNLAKKPFQLTTDPKFLWLGEKHKEALATLKYGVLEQKGFLLVTGEVGTGKTTLINALLESIDENTLVANINDPALNLIDFFNLIAISFKIEQKFESKVDFIVYFSQFLKKVYSENKGVLLIIDEVHSLSQELLEHIRLLSNIELPEEKLLNIFLIGQNEIHQTLALPQFRAIRQRISLAYQIQPLTERETSEYIKHRLKIAGTEREIFTRGAIWEIYRFSNGYPRLINVICDISLLTAYSRDLKEITPAIVWECSQEYSFVNKTFEKMPLNTNISYHPESRFHNVDGSFYEDTPEETTALNKKTTAQDMPASQQGTVHDPIDFTQKSLNQEAHKVQPRGKQIGKIPGFLKAVVSSASRLQIKRFPGTNLIAAAARLRNKMFFKTNLMSFAERIRESALSRAAVASLPVRSKKRLFLWMPVVSLTIITISFLWFFQKEGVLKNHQKTSPQATLEASTTSVANIDPPAIVTPKAPEKNIDEIPSNQIQKSPVGGISSPLEPSPFELAKNALAHKNFTRAIELFDRAMAQHPTDAATIKYYYSKALREQALGVLETDPYTAKKLLVRAIEADPKNAGAFFDLGTLHTKSKDYQKAIFAYQEAAHLDYRSTDAYYNLGFIYASAKNFAAAEKMFLRVVDLKPPYLDKVFFNLAVVQQKQGKKQQCLENLEKAIEINPNNQRTRQYLERFKNDKEEY